MQHQLDGRREEELLWFQRRSVLQAAAAWMAGGGSAVLASPAALAQGRSNVVEFSGDVQVNGARMRTDQVIQTGDSLETGPGSRLVFVISNSSFLVRERTRMTVERGASINEVSVLRMLTGAVASVWGKGTPRLIATPTLTAGIRGTGVYTEVFPDRAMRSYFCNCYGTVDMGAGGDTVVSQSSYHQAFWGEPEPVNGRRLRPAPAINHTDEELEFLARLVSQRTAWQVMGRTGVKDGKGYMEERPGQMHPAEMLGR
jgi:hypothetical protein